MASFSAELHVAGQVIPLVRCAYATHQDIDRRGRVVSKVRRLPVRAEADVPRHQILEHWAADPHKRQPAFIVFRDGASGSALETLHLAAAYCTAYAEDFVSGDQASGSYRCSFTLADPDGWTLAAGGPTGTVAGLPAAGGAEVAVEVMTTVIAAATGQMSSQKSLGKPKLVAGSDQHKAQRWTDFQTRNALKATPWTYERWEKQYYTNMHNNSVGLGREREYAKAMNAESKTLKTVLTYRQIDLYKAQERYCGQLKTGKMSLNKQARTEDIPKDELLIQRNLQVEYILEKGASKPFLKALDRIGATYKIGPQIP